MRFGVHSYHLQCIDYRFAALVLRLRDSNENLVRCFVQDDHHPLASCDAHGTNVSNVHMYVLPRDSAHGFPDVSRPQMLGLARVASCAGVFGGKKSFHLIAVVADILA